MEPVVNGLEEIYSSEIEFRRIDANSQEGKPVFQYYNLQGHPSYVLLNSAGEVLWQGLGEQTSEILKEKIINTLEQ
jgi:hypothetical protein